VSDAVERRTVDLSDHPDLVVVYLGMRVQSPRGLVTLVRFGRQIGDSVDADPEGLLLHERLIFSLVPPHLGMRQYWESFEALERWTRKSPHGDWWEEFLADPAGTAFWHELYSARDGFEAVYDGLDEPVGMLRFASEAPATGDRRSARGRLGLATDGPTDERES
jgi:hypothetical protein